MSGLASISAALSRNADLIDEALLSGHVIPSEENERGAAVLTVHKVFVTDGRGKYKLSRQWRAALERSLGSRAEYSAQSSVIGGDIQALIGICQAIEAAGLSASARAEDLITEAENVIWGMREAVSGFLDTIEEQVRLRFRDEEEHEARLQRNRAYMISVRGLGDMLNLLQGASVMEALDLRGCDEVRREYQAIVFAAIPGFSDRSQALILDLQNMLIHNTRIAAEARRRVAIIRALSGVSRAELREIVSENPEVFITSPKAAFSPTADPNDPQLANERQEAAAKASFSPVRERREPPPPRQFREVDVSGIVMNHPALELIRALNEEIGLSGEARISEFVSRAEDSDLTPDEMFCVLVHETLGSARYDISILPPPSRLTTSRIEDVLVRWP